MSSQLQSCDLALHNFEYTVVLLWDLTPCPPPFYFFFSSLLTRPPHQTPRPWASSSPLLPPQVLPPGPLFPMPTTELFHYEPHWMGGPPLHPHSPFPCPVLPHYSWSAPGGPFPPVPLDEPRRHRPTGRAKHRQRKRHWWGDCGASRGTTGRSLCCASSQWVAWLWSFTQKVWRFCIVLEDQSGVVLWKGVQLPSVFFSYLIYFISLHVKLVIEWIWIICSAKCLENTCFFQKCWN